MIKRKQIDFTVEDPQLLTLVKRSDSQQAVSTGTATPIEFNAEDQDDRNFWDVGTPGQLVVPAGEGGDYLITAQCEVALDVAPPTGGYPGLVQAELGLWINGSRIVRDFNLWYDPSMSPCCLRLSRLVALSPGDVLTLVAYHNSGGTLYYSDGPGAEIQLRKLA